MNTLKEVYDAYALFGNIGRADTKSGGLDNRNYIKVATTIMSVSNTLLLLRGLYERMLFWRYICHLLPTHSSSPFITRQGVFRHLSFTSLFT
jgi:hypothetical protein